jgi:serine-type D-Ala-D-Ala carboxypeptidase/endopeptidase (penicillin-binding protein 4)
VSIEMRPKGSRLIVDNKLATVSESGRGTLALHRLAGSDRITVIGQIPAKSPPFVRTASVDNPTTFFAEAFRLALLEEGVAVIGDAIDIDELASKPDLSNAHTLAARRSPPISDLVTSMMKVSQNQYAEVLWKLAGGRPALLNVLETWGIGRDSYFAADGSGLSRYNYITSDALVSVLQRMHTDPRHRERFTATLPVAGHEGPLAKRLAGSMAHGKVRGKTGTVDNVRSIAGYVTTADGETLVFSIIANNFHGPTAPIDAAADKALLRLAMYSRHATTP